MADETSTSDSRSESIQSAFPTKVHAGTWNIGGQTVTISKGEAERATKAYSSGRSRSVRGEEYLQGLSAKSASVGGTAGIEAEAKSSAARSTFQAERAGAATTSGQLLRNVRTTYGTEASLASTVPAFQVASRNIVYRSPSQAPKSQPSTIRLYAPLSAGSTIQPPPTFNLSVEDIKAAGLPNVLKPGSYRFEASTTPPKQTFNNIGVTEAPPLQGFSTINTWRQWFETKEQAVIKEQFAAGKETPFGNLKKGFFGTSSAALSAISTPQKVATISAYGGIGLGVGFVSAIVPPAAPFIAGTLGTVGAFSIPKLQQEFSEARALSPVALREAGSYEIAKVAAASGGSYAGARIGAGVRLQFREARFQRKLVTLEKQAGRGSLWSREQKGFPVIERSSGAVLNQRQLQIVPKNYDVMQEYTPVRLGTERISPGGYGKGQKYFSPIGRDIKIYRDTASIWKFETSRQTRLAETVTIWKTSETGTPLQPTRIKVLAPGEKRIFSFVEPISAITETVNPKGYDLFGISQKSLLSQRPAPFKSDITRATTSGTEDSLAISTLIFSSNRKNRQGTTLNIGQFAGYKSSFDVWQSSEPLTKVKPSLGIANIQQWKLDTGQEQRRTTILASAYSSAQVAQTTTIFQPEPGLSVPDLVPPPTKTTPPGEGTPFTPPDTPINIPGFKLPGFGEMRRSTSTRKSRKSDFTTQYTPSLEAEVFNIKGKPAPFAVKSGLGLRPILRG